MYGPDLDHLTEKANASREPGWQVEQVSKLASRISLWGELPVAWAGHLAAGLAVHGLDIRRGSAKRSDTHGWLAEFEVALHGAVDPESLDYVALCHEERSPDAREELRLNHFDLARSSDGRSLELSLRAPDQRGFLGKLLGRLAFFSLFPEALSVVTVNGTAVDAFWLRGLGGVAPSSSIRGIVQDSLSRCLGTPPPKPPSSAPSPRNPRWRK